MNAYFFFFFPISVIHFKLALESDFIFKYESYNVAKTTFPQAFRFRPQCVLNLHQVFSQSDWSLIFQVGFDLMKQTIQSTWFSWLLGESLELVSLALSVGLEEANHTGSWIPAYETEYLTEVMALRSVTAFLAKA